jgi:hypothetical protein
MLSCYHGRTEPVRSVLSAPPFAGGSSFGRTMAESAPDWEAIGDVAPEGSVMFCSLIIGDSRCGRLGKSTRSRRRTFRVTRIATGAPGCRE